MPDEDLQHDCLTVACDPQRTARHAEVEVREGSAYIAVRRRRTEHSLDARIEVDCEARSRGAHR